MDGYDRSTYGDRFADVYDDWYHGVSDVDATVHLVTDIIRDSGSDRVLELGVGTGRLAIPLAAAGFDVVGVDTSEAMLDQLAARDPDRRVATVHGDMVADLPAGPFGVVLIAYNTIFNLESATRQQQLFDEIAARLAERGGFVVEAFVPDDRPVGSSIEVRSLSADRVVLSASVHDASSQRAEGQFIELTEAGGVRLRPWSIRYANPEELDAMAARAGLVARDRWETVDREPFTPDSPRHVTVFSRESAAL